MEGWNDGWKDGRKDGRTEERKKRHPEIHPCVPQDIGSLGPLPKKEVINIFATNDFVLIILEHIRQIGLQFKRGMTKLSQTSISSSSSSTSFHSCPS